MPRRKDLRAFTLVEMMVAVIILVILASMATAGYLHFRDRASMQVDQTNQRVIATAIKLYAYDNNSLPGSLSDLRPHDLQRAYAQVMGETEPDTVVAFLRDWVGEKAAQAHPNPPAHAHPHPALWPGDRPTKYLGPNPENVLTCPFDSTPPPLGISYALDTRTVDQPLAWLLNPGNAGIRLVYEADVAGGATATDRHRGGAWVETNVGGESRRIHPTPPPPPPGNPPTMGEQEEEGGDTEEEGEEVPHPVPK